MPLTTSLTALVSLHVPIAAPRQLLHSLTLLLPLRPQSMIYQIPTAPAKNLMPGRFLTSSFKIREMKERTLTRTCQPRCRLRSPTR